ncbi:DDE-type integrase/transposase/recombinase [Yersinia enterocolitica]
MSLIRNAFKRRHYPIDIIAQCVRWYLAYALSLRNLEEISGANTAALATLNASKPAEESITVRQNKYLNNLVEQDHRNIKRRIRSMLGFKSFRRAQTILAGIELVHMIRKEQLHHPTGDGLSPAEQFYLLAT